MIASSGLSRIKTLLKISVASVCACLLLAATSIQLASAQACKTGDTSSGDEAMQSTIKLQMPFIAGETWMVGGGGSFYGDNFHCNPWVDHYATDWNRDGDAGAYVLAAADGTVDFVVTVCPTTGLGCQVRINHADGYQTTYAHLQSVASDIAAGVRVKTGTLIGYVGKTGTSDPHLHLSFKHLESAGYLSYCNSNCDVYETPRSPQGYKPSPMMTTAGQVNLVDGASYMSVNGRIYLPSLRLGDGWSSSVQIRNMATSATANVTITVRATTDPANPCTASISLAPDQASSVGINCRNNFVHTSGYIDANQEIAVSVINRKTVGSTIVMGAYTGVPATATWGPLTLPHVARRLQTASGWSDSDIVIQNTSNTNANIQVTLTRSDLTTIQKDYWVPAFSSQVVQLRYEGGIPDNWYGSAVTTYTANTPNSSLAVVSDFFAWDGGTDYAYNAYPPESKAFTAYLPLFMVRRTTQSGAVVSTPLVVQNVSGATMAVGELVLSCTGTPSFAKTNNVAVPNNASFSFNPVSDFTMFPTALSEWYGPCQLYNYATRQFVVLAQYRYPANRNAAAHDVLHTGTDTQVFFPTIYKRIPTSGLATSVFVQNLSGQTNTVQFVYKSNCPNFPDIILAPVPLGPIGTVGASINHNHRQTGTLFGSMNDGWCGSLRVSSLSNLPIDGYVQITNINEPTNSDTIMVYNAMTQP